MGNSHKVYVHIFPNGKRYYGYTSKELNERFGKDGIGYKQQNLIWNAIQKYGWDNIEHCIVEIFDNEKDAKDYETKMIRKYKTRDPMYGYNIIENDEDLIVKKYFSDDGLYKNDCYVDLCLFGLQNYSLFDNFNSSLNTYNMFFENGYDLLTYHRFNTTEYSGLAFVDIDVGDVHPITEKEFLLFKNDGMFIFKCKALYGLNQNDITFSDIDGMLISISTKIVYSYINGEYIVLSGCCTYDYHKLNNAIQILNNERKNLNSKTDSFEKLKKFRSVNDAKMIRRLKNDSTMREVLQGLDKLCGA